MTIEKLKEIIDMEEYEFYGVRVDETIKYNIGDICYNSHQWWQDDPEDGSEYNEEQHCWDGGELDGTCCLQVTEENLEDVIKKSEMYFGENVTLIAGNYAEGGNDIGEIIISDAKVIAIVK